MKKKFDSQTAKKIINDYAEKLNYYIKENQILKTQLEDMKTTLHINKDLLFKYIAQQTKSNDNNSLISELKNENSRVTDMMNALFKEKTALEKKQELEDRIILDKETIDKEKENVFILENKIEEKDVMIINLKRELEKYYNNDISSPKEIFIGEPDKVNLELYNELDSGRELLAKITKLLNQEKNKSAKQEGRIKELEEKIQSMKQGKKIAKQMENIALFDYILSSDDSTSEQNDNESNLENFLNLESPVMKFPEKIKQDKSLIKETKQANGLIPKLDLTKVLAKYQVIRHVDIADPVKVSNRSSNDLIEKLKFQLKVCKTTIAKYKKKVEAFKRMVQALKKQYTSLKAKNEVLEHQIKKSGASTADDGGSYNKKDVNNTSMNGNTSIRFEEFEDDNEDDFNKVIREYNKTVVTTMENK